MYPKAYHFYRAHIVSGRFNFPYGILSAEVLGADNELNLEYKGYARVADGHVSVRYLF
jgi:hypothetical protein